MASPRSIEFKVGLFVVLCLALIAGMIIRFGQYRPGQKAGYEINVMFPNAAGLIKDAKVMYAGIPVGKVSGIELTEKRNLPVRVRLLIHEGVVIREDARFIINQSGFLGDRYVDVAPGSPTAEVLKAGSTIEGLTGADMNEAVNKVKAALDQVTPVIEKVDRALRHLNESVLSTSSLHHAENVLVNVDAASSNAVVLVQDLKQVVDENSQRLSTTLQQFQETSANLRSASKHADALVARGDDLLTSKEDDIRAAIKNLADASARLDALIASAQQGSGTVGRLLVDPSLYDEVLRLVQNWRRNGLLSKDRNRRRPHDEPGTPPRTNFQPARPTTNADQP